MIWEVQALDQALLIGLIFLQENQFYLPKKEHILADQTQMNLYTDTWLDTAIKMIRNFVMKYFIQKGVSGPQLRPHIYSFPLAHSS